MDLTAVADRIAADAHDGQTRRHGAPYIDHPRAVARIVQDLAPVVGVAIDDAVVAAALCHDVLEDSPKYTHHGLCTVITQPAADAVLHLTKVGKGADAVAAYYATLRKDGARSTKLIKVCDRLHNLSELHKAPSLKKLEEYVGETHRFVRPLAEDIGAGAVAAIDDAIANAQRNQGQLATPATFGIYAIVDGLDRVDALLDGGVARLQLRVKTIDNDRAWLALIEGAMERCRRRGVPLIVNDRADLAFAAIASGVHLGDKDLPPRHGRALLGPGALIGTSTHSLQQLKEADDEGGADHLALGPIWESPTKKGHAAVVGLDVLRAACKATQKPVVAIGGIVDVVRAAEVAAAGAAFAAVVSALDVDDAAALHLLTRRFSLAFAAARVSR